MVIQSAIGKVNNCLKNPINEIVNTGRGLLSKNSIDVISRVSSCVFSSLLTCNLLQKFTSISPYTPLYLLSVTLITNGIEEISKRKNWQNSKELFRKVNKAIDHLAKVTTLVSSIAFLSMGAPLFSVAGVTLLIYSLYGASKAIQYFKGNDINNSFLSEDTTASISKSYSLSSEDNVSFMKEVLDYSRQNGESWKEVYARKPFVSKKRLQPRKIIENTLLALDEISKEQDVKKLDKHVLLKKKIVEEGSEVITTGDLHGDAYSLVKMLDKLIEEKKLNPDTYELNVDLVFLGDYVDRGPDSWAVLAITSRLKLMNMDRVHLVRGNHEYVTKIHEKGSVYGDWLPKDGVCDKTLRTFFKSIPFALFIGVEKKEEDSVTEYDMFTHGAFPLTFTPQSVVNEETYFNVPRDLCSSTLSVSDRRFSLIDPQSQKLSDLPKKLRTAIKISLPQGERYINREWDRGDIGVSESKKTCYKSSRGVDLSKKDVVRWMNFVEQDSKSSKGNKLQVRRLFKGHSHLQGNYSKDDHHIYFLDTDLYKKGDFMMLSHNVGSSKGFSNVFVRKYQGEFMKFDS